MKVADAAPFLHGCIRFEEKDGYAFPRRFTEKQDRILADRGFIPHSKASAGMRIEFLSRGGKMSFDLFFAPGAGSDFSCIALYDNGFCVKRMFESKTDFERHFEFELKQGEKRKITLYLGNLNATGIKNVVLPDDAEPVKKKIKYLALGDSITHGYFATNPALSYANILADNLNAEIVNQAIGGNVFCPDNIDPKINFQPDIITVAYGTNDWWLYDRNIVDKNTREYFAKLKNTFPEAKIFVLTPIYRGHEEDVRGAGTLDDVRGIIAENACGKVIDGLKLFDRTHGFYADGEPEEPGLHPNDLGFVLYAQRLLGEMRPFLGEMFDTSDKI